MASDRSRAADIGAILEVVRAWPAVQRVALIQALAATFAPAGTEAPDPSPELPSSANLPPGAAVSTDPADETADRASHAHFGVPDDQSSEVGDDDQSSEVGDHEPLEQVSRYRRLVQEVLTAYHTATAQALSGGERQLVLDTKRDHYLLLVVGWQGQSRTHACVLHLDIKDGQVWIQQDGTEHGIAYDLLERGVPRQDIVLGFQPPSMRPDTEFGSGHFDDTRQAGQPRRPHG